MEVFLIFVGPFRRTCIYLRTATIISYHIPFRPFLGEFAKFRETTGSFMFVRPRVSTLLPLAEFLRNLILGTFIEMCRENRSLVKIGQGGAGGSRELYVST